MIDPSRFDHFEVLRKSDGALWELGRGTMGTTYKAFNTNFRCAVALKVINPQYVSSDTARYRFLREARAAAQFRHPNVASVFHLGNSENGFFYAMEFVDGETVERRVADHGPLDLLQSLRITRQVTRALIAAERKQLIHRDIKPANLMLARDEDDEEQLLVKVIDFGLAKSLLNPTEQSGTVTLAGFAGTPHFASPEQLEEKELDIRSDLYSLGATLWYMLFGHPPFQGPIASVIAQQLSAELPATALGQLPAAPREVLCKLLAKKPADRFSNPTELKSSLDRILQDLTDDPQDKSCQSPDPLQIAAALEEFATGQLVRNRYKIIGPSAVDRRLYEARDLHGNQLVAVRPVPVNLAADSGWMDQFGKEIERLRSVHHPGLLELFGLESSDRGAVLISEWLNGFSWQELLRARRELTWDETYRLAAPLARLTDFLQGRGFVSLPLRSLFVEIPKLPGNCRTLLRTPVSGWPPFLVKADPLALSLWWRPDSFEPTITVVDRRTGDAEPAAAQYLAMATYELLGGALHGSAVGTECGRSPPLVTLSEAGNRLLQQALTDRKRFSSATQFVKELQAVESGEAASVAVSPKRLAASLAARRVPEPVIVEDDVQPRLSPVLLSIGVTMLVLFLACAVGLLIFEQVRLGRHGSPSGGFVSVESQPEGASVFWRSQELGKTPVKQRSLPNGAQTVELRLPGYENREVNVNVVPGTTSDTGTLPLQRSAGHLILKTNPTGVPYEIIGSDEKLISGRTPANLAKLSPGAYVVRYRLAGWPVFQQPVSIEAGSSQTLEHTFAGGTVNFKSDPTGATIYEGEVLLGKTPFSTVLPIGQTVELTSKVEGLKPASERVTPGQQNSDPVIFRHSYGMVSITSDVPGGQVTISGIDAGRTPLQKPVSPGRHEFVLTGPDHSTESKEIEVPPGKVIAINFGSASANLRHETREAHRPALRAQTGGPRRPPVYLSKEDYDRARDEAFRRFDAEWDYRKRALKQAQDYYEYQADHSEGSAREKWNAKKEQADRQTDALGDARDHAKDELTRQWSE